MWRLALDRRGHARNSQRAQPRNVPSFRRTNRCALLHVLRFVALVACARTNRCALLRFVARVALCCTCCVRTYE